MTAALIAFSAPPFVAVFWREVFRLWMPSILLRRSWLYGFYAQWMISALGGAIGGAVTGEWPGASGAAASAVLAVVLWWLSRRRRRRARGAAGAKAQALRDAMVRTLRDRRVARPALAPGRA